MLIGSISEVLGDDRPGHDTHTGAFVVHVSVVLYLFIVVSSLVKVSGPLDDSYSHLPVAFIKSSTDFLQGGEKSMALLDKVHIFI